MLCVAPEDSTVKTLIQLLLNKQWCKAQNFAGNISRQKITYFTVHQNTVVSYQNESFSSK